MGVKLPVTPAGNVGTDRVTGELKEPVECTVTATVATAPGSRVRLAGLRVIVNSPTVAVVVVVTAVTVNVPLADFPVLPTATTVYPPGVALDDTVNPTLMFPPPKMVHDCEESSPPGPEISKHAESLENPVAEPETTVPTGPDAGFSVRVSTVPAVTAKVALAVSPAPPFVVAVTV